MKIGSKSVTLYGREKETMKKKNVLIIHADQHNADCLACYGNQDVETTNIDQLAGDGVRYENHYTVYPVCTPSRYSLVCSQYVHQHRGWSNQSTLEENIATFPKVLREHGYRTTAIGKMHSTPTYLDLGYDNMLLAEQCGKGRYEDDYHKFLTDKGLVDRVDVTDQVLEEREKGSEQYFSSFGAMESDLSCEDYSTEWIANRAMEELETWKKQDNNLLFVGFIKPHHPFDPPHPYSKMYDGNKLKLLYGYDETISDLDYQCSRGYFDYKTLTEESLRNIMALYYGSITEIDDRVGDMIQYLKDNDLYEDTMIIYTSDHGDYMGYHNMVLKGNHMYRPLTRIPLVIKYPNSYGKGRVDYSLSENIDVGTTILDVCDLPIPKEMEGISLKEESSKPYIFTQDGMGKGAKYMVRDHNHCLLLKGGSLDHALFFDLKEDPYEKVDQYNNPKYLEKIQEMKQFLAEKFLFSAVTHNYVEEQAAQIISEEEQVLRSQAVKDLIQKEFQPV